LLERGYTYVDVRSESEFLMGHPPGAFNIPIQRVEGDRLVDNLDFVAITSLVFRTTDPLVIGCRSGPRSHRALQALAGAGFADLRELEHGFLGARDTFGRLLPGWVQRGFAVEAGDGVERSYASLLARVRGPERG